MTNQPGQTRPNRAKPDQDRQTDRHTHISVWDHLNKFGRVCEGLGWFGVGLGRSGPVLVRLSWCLPIRYECKNTKDFHKFPAGDGFVSPRGEGGGASKREGASKLKRGGGGLRRGAERSPSTFDPHHRSLPLRSPHPPCNLEAPPPDSSPPDRPKITLFSLSLCVFSWNFGDV